MRAKRSWLVSWRIDANLVLLDDSSVLLVGGEPDAREILDLVVDTRYGIPVDKPFGRKLRPGGPEWQDAERHGVIGKNMVPGRRVMEREKRSDVGLGRNEVAQRSADRR
jgi:hypothetical protein